MVHEIKIQIVYNDLCNKPGFIAGKGFAAWIEKKDSAILFDVGGNDRVLLKNIEKANLNLDKLKAIVISHNHWDHIYGLPLILQKIGNRKVYVPAYSAQSIQEQNPRANVIAVKDPIEIFPNIYSTGELFTEFKKSKISEQALIIKHNKSISIVTGCAHAGIEKLIERAIDICPETPIDLITGGFHLKSTKDYKIKGISDRLKKHDIRRIAPSHCTGTEAIKIFEEEWGSNFVNLILGENCNL